MKLLIAGGRDFANFELLKEKITQYYPKDITEIVSGTANGADRLGEQYGYCNCIPIKKFPADWKIGKQAGMLRNEEMAKYCDCGLIFWDGKSHGTRNMIYLLSKHNKPFYVVKY